MIALIKPEAKFGVQAGRLWLQGQANGSQFYVTPGVIASTIRIASDSRLWAEKSNVGEVSEVVGKLLKNSFFQVKRETDRTVTIFLSLVEKYSPHSQDVNDLLIAANALELGAKLVTADQGFHRYSEVEVQLFSG
ncbi:MAG: PIN domain-containing protein [Actinomycetia bacterium]|jgi:predicted nucleic acid-binding protein|nr:PIN domain-containing protein [Actinomycetes bacterium]